VRSLYTFVH